MHSDVFFAEVEIALKNTLKREVSVKEKKRAESSLLNILIKRILQISKTFGSD